jgi:hypothetical protein
MARITTSIMIFLILANASVTVMAGSGLTEDLGVTVAPGISDTADNVVSEMQNGFAPSTSVIESFISLAISGGQLFKLIVQSTYAVPVMFLNLGFPSWTIAFFAPAYLIGTVELVLLVLGRSGEGI